jgi:dihydroorotate dehydrogenase
MPRMNDWQKSEFRVDHHSLEREVLGLKFKNPVGLAAGFDKNARLIDELACFGFGFIEIGTLTPKAQPGNPKPRLFRLPKDQALINRMGFNNDGVEAAVIRLKRKKSDVIIGGNIGKNKNTPNEEAFNDYKICFEALYPYVDYFVINVSSPNTPGLRDLQEKGPLKKILTEVNALNLATGKPKPIFLKIAPDLTASQLDDVIEILQETGTKGVIATNTTISREGLLTSVEEITKIGAGGLSGKPLKDRSTEVIRYLRVKLGPDYAIMGVGGIISTMDAVEKIKAGADLIQIYTGFVYEGPEFVKKINWEIIRHCQD